MKAHNKFFNRYVSGSLLFAVCLLGSEFAANAQAESDSLNQWNEVPTLDLPDWQVIGAVSGISGDELRSSYTTNISNTLYGRLPGLTVQQSGGEPGSDSPGLNIRGIGTFGSGTGLHYVIDGFASTKDFFERLTPAEIESVRILKDATAVAMYGNRAANGVIVVTTKHGSAAPLRINFDARMGLQQGTRLPKWLGSYDYATLYNEALYNEGHTYMYTADDLNHYQTGDSPLLYPDVDWQKEIMRSVSPFWVYNLTADGGNSAVKYSVVFNGVNNIGLLKDPTGVTEFGKKQTFSRYNFRTNVDVRLSKRFSAQVIIGGSIENKTTPGTSETTGSLLDLAGAVAPNAFPVLASESKIGGNAMYANPIAQMTEAGFISYNGRTAQAALRVMEKLDFITPGLYISGAISFNNYYKSYTNKTRDYARYEVTKDSSGEISFVQHGEDKSLSIDEGSSYQWRNLVAQGNLGYRRCFAGKNYLDILTMVDYDEYTVTGGTLPYKNLGFSGRLSYSYDKRYIAEFTFGSHGNDNFPKTHRFGFFPAGALAWVISEEPFLKGNAYVNHLKIRASYGLVGNQDIGGERYMYNQYYSWGGYYIFGNGSFSNADTYTEGLKANPNVTWEKDRKMNLGIEATFFKGLYLSFDYFRNHRTDILTKPYSSMPGYLGYTRPYMNLGIVDNNGFELSIGYHETEKTFKWHADASLWYAHNNVVFNSEAPQVYNYRYSTGHIIGQPFALEAIGFFADKEDIAKSPVQIFDDNVPGDIKYKDQNGDGKVDQDDFYPIGYTGMPEITAALDLGFEVKGFDFRAIFQGALNRTVYLSGRPYRAFQDNGKITEFALGRWTPETADSATYPRLSTTGEQNNFQYSSFWQRNGNFLKLRNLEMGYTFTSPVLSRAKIDGIRLYLLGTNLFSLDHMGGLCDPEVITGYPSLRTYQFGLNIKF